MHRALNIKHRIVRRIDVGKAPLATFDTFDLDDGESQFIIQDESEQSKLNRKQTSSEARLIGPKKFINREPPKSEIIGGNNSKKSLSQAGGGKDERKDVEATTVAGNDKENPDETGTTTASKYAQPQPPLLLDKDATTGKDKVPVNETPPGSEIVAKDNKDQEEDGLSTRKDTSSCSTSGLIRQGTLGRVSIPIRKQDSVSSSSSSETCNDTHFNFSATRPSIAHLDSADAGPNLPDSAKDKDTVSSLIPDNIDPSQILSPSKRKAYEKRIERLKVTTSPIARPRSTAPINVVTLDEYANLSSPEASPASPSVLQDKLKITLPSDEFAAKPKTPKHLSAKKHDSEETCFEFTEDLLFRCTKSALVVEEDGHLPLSPRRVLIPPTITPSTSPKLSTSPKQGKDDGAEDAPTSVAPKLIYFKEDISAQTFFGKTVDQPENENWADFPDSRPNFEKADSESPEKEVRKASSYLSKKVSLADQQTTASVTAEGVLLKDSTNTDNLGLSSSADIDSSLGNPELCCGENVKVSEERDHPTAKSPDNSPMLQTSYNIKENSDDVLVLEIVQHRSDIEEQTSVQVSETREQVFQSESEIEDQASQLTFQQGFEFKVQASHQKSDIKEQTFHPELEIKEQVFQQKSEIKEQAFQQESDIKEQSFQQESEIKEQSFQQESEIKEQAFQQESDIKEQACQQESEIKEQAFQQESDIKLQAFQQKSEIKEKAFQQESGIKEKAFQQESEIKEQANIIAKSKEFDFMSEFVYDNKEAYVLDSEQSKLEAGNHWALFETVSQIGEENTTKNPSKTLSENGDVPGQSPFPLVDLKETLPCTAESQSSFPNATSLLDSSTASLGDGCRETLPWFLSPLDSSTTNDSSSISPSKGSADLHDELFLIDSQPFDQGQQPFAPVTPEDPQPHALASGQVTLTPFSDLHSSSPSPSDLMSFSSSQDAEDTVTDQ